MIAPMGATTRDQHLYKIQQDAVGEIETKKLWPVRFVPLIGDEEI